MKKVEPYRSFEGASRALDNGGRLWNVFTTAGDRVITAAEVGKAGAGGGWAGALLFLDLVTSRLKDTEREELLRRLEPKLRRRWQQSHPLRLKPGEVKSVEDLKRPVIVAGTARRIGSKTVHVGYVPVTIMVGSVPVITQVPATEVHAVYEVTDGRGTCHVLGPRRSRLPEGEPLAFGGLVKTGRTGKGKGSEKRLFLGARYWQRAWSES